MATGKYLEWRQFVKLHCQVCWTVKKSDFYLSISFTLERNKPCLKDILYQPCLMHCCQKQDQESCSQAPWASSYVVLCLYPAWSRSLFLPPNTSWWGGFLSCQATWPPAPGATAWGRRSRGARVPSPSHHLCISGLSNKPELTEKCRSSPFWAEMILCLWSKL